MKSAKKLDSLSTFKMEESKVSGVKGGFTLGKFILSDGRICVDGTSYRPNGAGGAWINADCD